MMKKVNPVISIICLLAVAAPMARAQEKKNFYIPEIHGTVRAKYEYKPSEGKGRFEVRNARVSVEGKIIPIVGYKAEIDLSDEGSIKMLDAYVRLQPVTPLKLTVGQMRVPFTIDAHRSPHLQYFANRSFIAKQVGNVRDVGGAVGWTFDGRIPVTLDGGIFNGSGLTNQKNFWTAYWDNGRWHIEAEYLRKHYAHDSFSAVNAIDAFAAYRLPLRKGLTAISFLGRYDYMSDHNSGGRDDNGSLTVDDPERHRITGGLTFSLGKKNLQADIRLNYEQYFYNRDATPSISEHSKFVLELVTHF